MNKKQIYSPQQSLFEEPTTSPEPSHPEEDNYDYCFDLIDALNAPIITYSEQWADTMPKRFIKMLPTARLAAILQHEPLATLLECALYIYTRTLLAPMPVHWVNIYIHVSCQTLSDWFGEDRWDAMNAPRTLSEEEQSQLLDLRRRIYETRRKVLKQRVKDETKAEKVAVQETNPEKTAKKENTIKKRTPDQPSLF
jgi:hypothetical protein